MEAAPNAASAAGFSEKAFYLSEFRGRTLAIAMPAQAKPDAAGFEAVLEELAANGTRVALVATDPAVAGTLASPVLSAATPRLEGSVWRALQSRSRVGLVVPEAGSFASACCEIAVRLGLFKLVWLDPAGALLRPDGGRLAFLDLAELGELLSGPPPPRADFLREVQAGLSAGLPELNLCSPDDLGADLFTYAGTGTLFTRERYVRVRRLGIDDFDAAHDLIGKGVSEGYLAPRSSDAVEEVLANGFGAFVEGRHLAGIGALLQHRGARAGEIVSLYTLTRFVGEGVGGHLVRFALERARVLACESVFACTTSDRVVRFFERAGFEQVAQDRIPAEKWRDYDAARRDSVRCLARKVE